MPAWGVHFSGVCISLPSFLPLGPLRPRETKETQLPSAGLHRVGSLLWDCCCQLSARRWVGASTRDIPALPSLAV